MMKDLTSSLFIILFFCSCRHQENNSKNVFKKDSTLIIEAVLKDSTLNAENLSYYRKNNIPIYVKSVQRMNPQKGFYHWDYRKGHYNVTDTLFIFNEIKNYTPSSSRLQLIIPGNGAHIEFFLIKRKDKWKVVKDSTSMYLT